jgi:hypothetical protein
MNLKSAFVMSLILDAQTRPIPMCIILGEVRVAHGSLSRTLETPVGSRLSLGFQQCANFLGSYDLFCVSRDKADSLF